MCNVNKFGFSRTKIPSSIPELIEICDSKQWQFVLLLHCGYFWLVEAGIVNLVERLAMSLMVRSSNTGTERGFLFFTPVQSGSGFCLTSRNMDTSSVCPDCNGQDGTLVFYSLVSGSSCSIPWKK